MTNAEILISLTGLAASSHEAKLLLDVLDRVLQPGNAKPAALNILQLIRDENRSAAYKVVALFINRGSRELAANTFPASRAAVVRSFLYLREKLTTIDSKVERSEPVGAAPVATLPGATTASLEDAIVDVYLTTVGRTPVLEEIDIWKNNFNTGLPFHEFFLLMRSSPEAQKYVESQAVLPDSSDGLCVQMAYELILGRGAAAWEVVHWQRKLEVGHVSRTGMLRSLFDTANRFFSTQAASAPQDGLSCLIMGTGKHLTALEWQQQAQAQKGDPPTQRASRYENYFHINGEPAIRVSALASLYRGGDFIEQFMDNITSLDGFDDYCELVIVDADSPEEEYKTIKRYLSKYKNINYIRCNYRLGIYDAWNLAAKAARGEYLTNTNMDDLRRHDSFMLQAAALDNLPFVDVVYQDLYYTFDPRLSFAEIAAFGHQTSLPVVTPHNMIEFNSPHNAPMWRKRLHEELGYFNTRYKSAGDYEFWMRCLAAGKKFYKTNDPHVVYYQNPKGLSTRPDTRGVLEAMEVHKTYCRRLISEDVVMSSDDFVRKLNLPRASFSSPLNEDRYSLVQQALRGAARDLKYSAAQGVSQ